MSNLSIEGATIKFRNFSGAQGKYNPAGRRNFNLFLDADIAETLEEEGWNIRWLKPNTEDGEIQASLSVAVNFNNIPPKIVLITSTSKVVLTEDLVGMLDWAELENVDLIIRPYHWEVQGKSGIKAYLKTMYVTIVEDEFEQKYKDLPMAPQSALDATIVNLKGDD